MVEEAVEIVSLDLFLSLILFFKFNFAKLLVIVKKSNSSIRLRKEKGK